MLESRKLRVFLCHSSNDKPAVRELYQRLKAEGWIDPWLDEEKLYPGQDWDLEIEKAVEAAHAVIVFLSNNSVTKEGYIQRELRFVLRIADFKPEGTVFVIPVRLDDCQMPRRLSMWQYVDYFPERRKEWAFQRLLGSLKVRAEKLDVPMNNLAEEQTHREVAEKSERAVRERIERKEKDQKEKEAGEKAAREANGGIPNLDETSNVAGIAPSIINDLQGQIEEKTQPDITAWLRNVDVDAESTKTDTSKQSAEGTPEDDFRSWLAGLDEETEQEQPSLQSDSDLLNRLRAEAKEQARISADQEIEKESVDQVFQPAEDKKIWPDKLSIGEMDYIRIPKGKFVIGDSGEEHEVDILYDYWLARFEVTNEQFKKFVDDNNFVEPWSVINWEKKLDHPVVNISWYSTKAYCRWLHQKYYSEELPTDWVFRLPTEAEWEKAARGTKGRAWPWGNVFDKSRCNSATNIAVGLISFLDSNNTTPVGKYTPRGDSPFGIADMAGNVWEWTHSLYKEYPYRIDDGREIEDAKGNRVRRGGSFSSIAADVRTFSRFRGYPSLKDANGGFRVALAPKLQ